MELATYVCNACTTASIAGLGGYTDAKTAMLVFCKKALAPYENRMKKGEFKFQFLDAFWLFTAGPEEPGHGHSKAWVKYGSEFAAFIRTNKLGRIVSAGKKINQKYHPDTTCQTWLWSPNQAKMEAWYTENIPKAGDPPMPPSAKDSCAACGDYFEEHTLMKTGKYKCPNPYGNGLKPTYWSAE